MSVLQKNLSHPKYRPDIDGLRALAVLSVVIFHAFPSKLSGGFIGVDVFFVISGYLISTIVFESLDRGTFSFTEFYTRRIRRIFPALIMVLAACYAIGWFALFADEYTQLGKHIAAGAGFVSNIVLWYEASYFDNSSDTKPLLHLWSLGIEEQFYIAWPLLIWLAWKAKLNFFVVTLLLAAASFFLNLQGIHKDATATFYSPLTRFWELLCGSLLAWLMLYKQAAWHAFQTRCNAWFASTFKFKSTRPNSHLVAHGLSFAGFFVLVYGFVQIHKNLSFPGAWAAWPVLGACLMIAAGPSAWINHHILSNKLAVGIGLISYPLYLWHWPLLSFARIVESGLPHSGLRAAIVLASIALAWLTYKFLEQPVRHGQNGRRKMLVLVALMTIMGILGYHAYRQKGYAFRDAVKNYTQNKISPQELLKVAYTDSRCLAYEGLPSPLFTFCRFSQASSHKTVAVIGDSHAGLAYLGIAEYLKEKGISTLLLANAYCPPFLGTAAVEENSEREACKLRIEQLLSVVQSRPDIQQVFFLTRGPVYLTGTQPVDQHQKVSQGLIIPPAEFLAGAQSTINRLVQNGKSVFYVTENPELSFEVESCIARPLGRKPQTCRIETANVMQRQRAYLDLIGQLKNVTVINSLKAFCPSDECLVFDKGVLMYLDDDHLSLTGSRFQVQNLLRPYLP